MTAGTSDNGRPSPSRLYRSERSKVLLGVCGGIADYVGVEPWVVRVFTVIAGLMFAPPTLAGYLILAFLLPKAPQDLYRNEGEQRFWRDVRIDPAQKFSELRHRFRELERQLQRMEAYVTSKSFRLNREIKDLER